MDRRTALARIGTVAVGALAGCITGGSENYAIGMADSAFEPVTHTASVGDTVVWKNTSNRAHTVTAYDGQIPENGAFFASGDFSTTQAARKGWKNGKGSIYSGETYENTFEVPGTFHYFCIPHERAGMVGKVVVEE